MFKLILNFPRAVWALQIVALVRTAAFMTAIPYLAIILQRDFALDFVEIGLLITVSASLGIVMSIIFGNLSDQFGRRKIILFGYVLFMIGMAGVGFATQLWVIIFGVVVTNLANGITGAPTRALLTDYIKGDRAMRDVAIQSRYFFINIGGAVGPQIGLVLAAGTQTGFVYLIWVYFILFVYLALIFMIDKPNQKTVKTHKDTNLLLAMKIVSKDKVYLILIGLLMVINIAFSQLDTGLLLDISNSFKQNLFAIDLNFSTPQQIFANLLTLNGILIVIFHLPMVSLLGNFSLFTRAYIGLIFLVIGYLFLALSNLLPMGIYYSLLFAMLILTFGELILFPSILVLQDRLAPEHLKGSYFGVAGLSQFGHALAPLIGGFLLMYFGREILWLSMMGIFMMVATGFLFLKNNEHK